MISTIPKWIGNLFGELLRPNLTVLETSYISPQIKKIRFAGDISAMNFQIGYANVFRVSETEYRNYTVSFYDKKKGIIDIIFHIHDNGAGSRYIDGLHVGANLYSSGPRGRKLYDPLVKQYYIFGDESSLGLACSFLPLLIRNQHRFQFCFELNEENKDVPRLLGLKNCTIFPKTGLFKTETSIKQLPVLKTSDWINARFVLTGNAKSVQVFRNTLRRNTARNIVSQGYWLEGKRGL
jgi:hypothetical protein